MINTQRHSSYFQPRDYDTTPITIIGAGATGSRVFEACVNLGLRNIHVYDFDVVESHNLANQLFTSDDLGSLKTESLSYWCRLKLGTDIPTEMGFYEKKVIGNMKNDIKGIVFLLTDTMESRREIWKNSLWLNPKVSTVIETRMALTHGDIYQFNPSNAHQNRLWNESLIDDDDAEVSACGTSLSVGTTASIIANMAVSQMMHFMKEEPVPNHVSIYLHPLIITDEEWKEKSVA